MTVAIREYESPIGIAAGEKFNTWTLCRPDLDLVPEH